MSTRSDSRQPHPDDPLHSVGPRDRRRLLTGVLRRVSRAFYLTLRVLPRALRTPIGLAYLLARAADTIADARAATPTRRLVALRRFRATIARPAGVKDARALSALAARFAASDAERTLADSLPVQLSLLESPAAGGRRPHPLRRHHPHARHGGRLDVFPRRGRRRAGRVPHVRRPGPLHVPRGRMRRRVLDRDVRRENARAVRLGHPPHVDTGHWLRQGAPAHQRAPRRPGRPARRAVLPAVGLAGRRGPAPRRPARPGRTPPVARPVLARGIRAALERYRDAEDYALAVPRRCVRLRLAVLWPALMGLATLALLAGNDRWLDPSRPSKVTRGWVYRTLALSLLTVASNSALRLWFRRLRTKIEISEL